MNTCHEQAKKQQEQEAAEQREMTDSNLNSWKSEALARKKTREKAGYVPPVGKQLTKAELRVQKAKQQEEEAIKLREKMASQQKKSEEVCLGGLGV